MKKYIAMLALVLLAACQSMHLEDDPRYAKLATVVDRHDFSELERKQAKANTPSDSNVSIGIGVGSGIGYGGGFGSMMFGMGRDNIRDDQPKVAKGAIRYTVQLLGSEERVEVMSYLQYKVGDCVKVLANHPDEYPRFFDLKPGEHCE